MRDDDYDYWAEHVADMNRDETEAVEEDDDLHGKILDIRYPGGWWR